MLLKIFVVMYCIFLGLTIILSVISWWFDDEDIDCLCKRLASLSISPIIILFLLIRGFVLMIKEQFGDKRDKDE